MKKIEARIIADSINPVGNRITTFILTFPRFILAELNTHRAFSRNSASSRAIPFAKMVKMVEEDPFIPIAWQKDHKGMQGTEYFTNPDDISKLVTNHLRARDKAVEFATYQNELGLTKQLCNRYLEPFMWHTCIVTATDFENFFNLRTPQYTFEEYNDYEEVIATHVFHSKKDALKELGNFYSTERKKFIEDFDLIDWLMVDTQGAEIHMRLLAESMWDALNESKPQLLNVGEWHIPFGDNMDKPFFRKEEDEGTVVEWIPDPQFDGEWVNGWKSEQKRMVAVARCARLSYNTHDGEMDYQKDIAMYEKLRKDGHWSPFEHIAFALDQPLRHGNLIGWVSQRTMLENEAMRKEMDAI